MIDFQQPSTPPVDPTWLQVLERLGLPIFLILFGCAIVWKLLPHVIEWFKTNSATAKVVAEAIPDMKDSLHKMANDGQKTLESINVRTTAIEERTKELENKQDLILSRLPSKGS